jgi:hypothetical protein
MEKRSLNRCNLHENPGPGRHVTGFMKQRADAGSAGEAAGQAALAITKT